MLRRVGDAREPYAPCEPTESTELQSPGSPLRADLSVPCPSAMGTLSAPGGWARWIPVTPVEVVPDQSGGDTEGGS